MASRAKKAVIEPSRRHEFPGAVAPEPSGGGGRLVPLPAKRIAAPIRLHGHLDRVKPDGTVEGWCWSPDLPDSRRTLAVLIDDTEVVRVVADRARADLAAAGVGDGRHAFRHLLTPAMLRPGARVLVSLRDVATGAQVGDPVVVDGGAAVVAARPGERAAMPELRGNLDRVSRDGWVSGWCWYPERANEHVELTVLVDDTPVGTVRADTFRADLQQAGIGDGTHGFSYALPFSSLAERGTMTIAVQETGTGRNLSDPITMRLGRMAAAEERIEDLERQTRLLRGQIAELRRVSEARDDDRAARELFATVAAFFQDLAQGGSGTAPAQAAGEASLAGALAEVTGRWPPLDLALPERPQATICIAASAPLDTVRACLGAIGEAGLDRAADVLVLDDGAQGAAMALLPSVVRNLRYLFLQGREGMVGGRNEVARTARGEFLVFLAPEARLTAGWLEEVAGTFAREPAAAAVCGRLLREDGLLQHAGLFAEDGALRDPGRLAPAEAPEHGFMQPVDAVAGFAFAVRREALLAAGGFSGLFRGFGHAVADLCARLRAAGQAVLYQPVATALWADRGAAAEGEPPNLSLPDEETLRLRERLHAGWPAPVRPVGHALVIDDDLPRPNHNAGSIATFEQMLLLRRLGYRVTFAPMHADSGATPDLVSLARNGIEVARPPHWRSVTEYLKAEGERLDLVHIYRYTSVAMLHGRVRELAPRAKLVFATADLHFLREERHAQVHGQKLPAATRQAELQCMRDADATILTNDYEHEVLRAEIDPDRLVLLRWITRPVPPVTGFAERRDICFVGNFRHAPNSDGVQWFITEVLPRVRARLPGLRLRLAGADMPPQIAALASDAVEVLGWVADLAALFGAVRLSVSPLRFGAGFKGKLATSMAHGLPAVGSTISLEGTGLADGDGVAVADDPNDFADAIVRLHEDAALWQAQSARALERVAALYSPEAALAVWRRTLGRLGLPAAG